MLFCEAQCAVRTPLQVGIVPVENVQLALAPGAEREGHVTVEGDKNPTGLWRSAVPKYRRIRLAQWHGDLRFGTGLGPGHYGIDWSPYRG
jgi:hypothetical protein